MKKNEIIFYKYFNVLKNRLLYCFKKRRFLLFFIIQVLFQSPVFSQKADSIVQDSLQALKFHAKGVAAGRLGDYEEAISCFNQVYNIFTKLYGDKSVRLVSPLNNLGIQYKKLHRLDNAIEVYKKAETLYIGAFGDDYPL